MSVSDSELQPDLNPDAPNPGTGTDPDGGGNGGSSGGSGDGSDEGGTTGGGSVNVSGGLAYEPIRVTCGYTFPEKSSMRQLMIELTAQGKPVRTVKFEAQSGVQYVIDVSTAVRSLMDEPSMPGTGVSVPSVIVSYTVKALYLLEGYPQSVDCSSGSISAVLGGRSEYERFINKPHSYVTKPTGCENERVCMGSVWVTTDSTGRITLTEVKTENLQNLNVYAEAKREGYHFELCFLNRMGGYESAVAYCCPDELVNVNSGEFRRASSPSGDVRPTLLNVFTEHRTSLELSSGAVTAPWARWWAGEFLAGRRYWMRVNNQWVPVSVKPKQGNVRVLTRSKVEASSVEFTVTLGVSGVL